MSKEKEEVLEEKVEEEVKVEEEKNTEPEKDELKELNDKYLRLLADFQNQKKRFDKEKVEQRRYALEEVINPILNVVDNFERALNVESTDEKFKEGMNMILKQLLDELAKVGVKEIEALGNDFDPNFHNAVMMEDTTEFESGKVSLVIQKGYLLNNRVIRPAMVKVAN